MFLQVQFIMDIPINSLDEFVRETEGADIIIGLEGDYKKNFSEDMKNHIYKIYVAVFMGI